MELFIGPWWDEDNEKFHNKSIAAAALWGATNFIALVVFVRWLAGAVSQAPPTAVICAAGTLLAAAGIAANLLFHQLDFRKQHWAWGALSSFVTLFPLLVTLSVIPSESSMATWYVCGMTCLSLAVVIGLETKFRHQQSSITAEPQQPTTTTDAVTSRAKLDEEIDPLLEAKLAGALSAGTPGEEGETAETPWRAENVSHWMTRTDGEDGGISLEGVTLADFAAGQSRSTIHLSFCPALPATPQLECEAVDDAEVRLKVAAIYPHGARIELTRPPRETGAAVVAIGYFAHLEQNHRNGAAA